MPKVSVLMAVHNGLPYLQEAVENILRQTLGDFEFIVIDDASIDGSDRVLRLVSDRRVRLFTNKKHLGLSRSLNKGWALARGKYIARMDHDDISLPGRLAAQYAFMESHLEIDVLGTWVRTLGLNREQIWRYPTSDAEIKAEMLFNSALVHSSVILRRSTFEKFDLRYDPGIDRAQDYELWTRAASRLHFGNLGKVYLFYRIHHLQVGKLQSERQQAAAAKVRLRELRAFGIHPTRKQQNLHNLVSQWRFTKSYAGFHELECWLLTLKAQNKKIKRYSPHALNSILERRWWAACRHANDLGEGWRYYKASSLSKNGNRSFLDKAHFAVKALMQ